MKATKRRRNKRGQAAMREAQPQPQLVPRARNTAFEAGAQTRRTLSWRAPSSMPNDGLLPSLGTIRSRSRHAVRNDGFAGAARDRWVANLIGTGIKPLSQADPHALRQAIHATWNRWVDESDADGLLDFYGQQTQVAGALFEAGEVFARLRLRHLEDGLSVPIQVQVIEPELVPFDYTTTLGTGRKVRAGIEFDAIGRRVAYWFYRQRPGDQQDLDTSEMVRVPAWQVIHVYEPTRPGQLRGVPRLARALVRLWELDKYDDAVLLRQELANMLVGFIRKPATPPDQTDINPLTGLAYETGPTGDRVISFEPGAFHELDYGEDVQFSDPPDAGPNYPHYVRQQLFSAAAAAGVPYEVMTGDMRGVNDRTVRVLLNEFRRALTAVQHQIIAHQFCRRVYHAWLDQAFLTGAIPAIPSSYAIGPEPVRRVKWMTQGWAYIHPVQDIQAQREAILAGFTTRSAVVAEQGEDAEAIDLENALDNERADELGLKYTSDGRHGRAADMADDSTSQDDDEPVPAGAGVSEDA